MGRNTKDVRVEAPGRDLGKVFRLTEMPAEQAEAWGIQALSAMVRSGVAVPTEVWGTGMAGVAAVGLGSLMGIRYEDARPLLKEMFDCVLFMPDQAHPEVLRAPNLAGSPDIEEIATRIFLRYEVLRLHVDFSSAAGFLMSVISAAKVHFRNTSTPDPSAEL